MSFKTIDEVYQAIEKIKIPQHAYIDGNFVDTDQKIPCISPVDGRRIGDFSACSEIDVNQAVISARHAFEYGSWRKKSVFERKVVLLKLADILEERATTLALLESYDMGKPIVDSLNIDIPAVINCLRWHAECLDKLYDEIAPSEDSVLATITKEPVGVVAAIVPWNFPLLMAMWKIAPALAVGNSVILKPAEQSSLTALYLAKLIDQYLDLDDGVFQVITGYGGVVGKALGLHMDVDCLAFTGSTAVGKQLMQYSGCSNLKKVWLECGGKSPNIVCADADNLDEIAKHAAWAIFFNQGEVCTAGSRLLVERSIHQEFIKKVIQCAKTIKIGNPFDPKTEMGAVVSDEQFNRINSYIQSAYDEKVTCVLNDKNHSNQKGFYISPVIFDNVSVDAKIAKEEIFGPVLAVIPFDNFEQAIKIANQSEYGLAAALWTSNLKKSSLWSKKITCWDGMG